MIWGKHRNCSPKPEYQLIKKSDGVIKIGRVKSYVSSYFLIMPSSNQLSNLFLVHKILNGISLNISRLSAYCH